MSIKTFLLGRMNRAFARDDLPPRDDATHIVGDHAAALAEPPPRLRGGPSLDHLGAYRPLVGAVREELERFVASDLRLHLAIAERDRFVLAAIAIECVGHEESPGLLQRFIREFAPEQVKHYLAREIIARLPNASAIDLSQFAGLEAADAEDDADHAYDDLIAELRSDEPATARPYDVTLVGRWAEATEPRTAPSRTGPTPPTPLAGLKVTIEVEDAGGARRVELPSAVPGRRYVVGKDPACDIVVDGLYASRRHCELWLDKGAWWVADCGSTNGIRVDQPSPPGAGFARPFPPDGGSSNVAKPHLLESVLERGALLTSQAGDGKVLAVAPGAYVVLSASSRGEPAQYPRLRVQPREIAAKAALLHTPVTPIVATRRVALTLTAQMASGARTVELPSDATRFSVGRSRSQSLVVDWAHEGVSGHHVDIEAAGDDGARVRVHGDNGVKVAGTTHAAGALFEWKVGEAMVLGRTIGDEPQCSLTLSRAP